MNERRGFLIGSILLLGFISFLMIKPLLGYFLGAIVLAFILHPVQKQLRKLLGHRVSAFILVILGIVLIVLPFIGAAAFIIEDASDLAADVQQSDLINTTELENRISHHTGQQIDIENNIRKVTSKFTEVTVGGVSQLVNVLAKLTIGITLLLFLLYYLLKDGEKLVKWTKELTPLPEDIQESLYDNINSTTWAVIKGHVLVAVVQGLVAGLGLYLTGVPNWAFWTFMMVLLGFIPIIGTIVVWFPAAIYLFLIDQVQAAVFLLVYGFLIVGLTDNILRPLAVDRGSNLHPAVIIIGVIGGVYIFGAIGLFIGPIMLGVFKSVLLVFKDHYHEL